MGTPRLTLSHAVPKASRLMPGMTRILEFMTMYGILGTGTSIIQMAPRTILIWGAIAGMMKRKLEQPGELERSLSIRSAKAKSHYS